ncbi:centromere localized protein Cnl2 [Schizosaccharomyces cryophilus OY26]|uniref:Centromere localized protein Cnl2 n=1 Tax=Schizosaccharomyces cryophilus (strain OY26 / ATCC MYA-4695 / CBS 11777 / NBRC 106824 / NRRL Y48691) TaxID=653667 RepID=S9X1N7_SCHCR|nr:centromere localized protein Cnl2 [Schizosaccharomyces cryophilus OY26]EPY51017.1 centromere localized protein Cnl2 [Schizosaccharomyces cryophilus OY26]
MEQKILSDYLLSQGTFSSIIHLQEWKELFPRRFRDEPLLVELYDRCTKQQQNRLKKIKANIEIESQILGKNERDQMLSANIRKFFQSAAPQGSDQDEFYTTYAAKPLDITAINQRLENALQSVKAEVDIERKKCSTLSSQLDAHIDSLNDLKWSQEPNLEEPVALLDDLIEQLERRCNEVPFVSNNDELD